LKDFYNELRVKTDKKDGDRLFDMVNVLYDDAIEFGGGVVILRDQNSFDEFIESIKRFNELSDTPISLEFDLRKKENIDWIKSYQESISPIEAGRFYIHPEWYQPKDGKVNIIINPALAFGSGHHPTTHSSLLMIEKFVKSGDEVLDVGCGSGILSIASAKMGADVELCDTDSIAVESAIENFKLNCESFGAIWRGSINKTTKKYDKILANIVADVLKALSSQLKGGLKDGGVLILSGVLDKKESVVKSAFDDLKMVQRVKSGEWITLVYKKGTGNGEER
jgi:ribosomal protein L11 methyltransferase